ncbi:MAG: plasmid pRiA4b ORF-3 family protein [Methanosphaera stadtmanae]|jgi:hypothetical protein|nr:plasmid pRiA4b ORF-3 family protein [Methanosphaera stadtmanae]
MNGFDILFRLDDVSPVTNRRIIVPEGITFKRLHEIIQLAFGFDNQEKYKFSFDDFSLEIIELNSINPDNINATTEPIDKYFQAFDKAKYMYDFKNKWTVTLEISQVEYEKDYPQFIEYHGRYNPFDECLNKDNFMMLLDMKKNPDKYDNLNDYVDWLEKLKFVNKLNVNESLMQMFNVPFKKVGHRIVEVEVDPNYSLDDFLAKK